MVRRTRRGRRRADRRRPLRGRRRAGDRRARPDRGVGRRLRAVGRRDRRDGAPRRRRPAASPASWATPIRAAARASPRGCSNIRNTPGRRRGKGGPIPEVLVSGDHGRIAEWRRAEAERLTRRAPAGPRGPAALACGEPKRPVSLQIVGDVVAAHAQFAELLGLQAGRLAIQFVLLVGIVVVAGDEAAVVGAEPAAAPGSSAAAAGRRRPADRRRSRRACP